MVKITEGLGNIYSGISNIAANARSSVAGQSTKQAENRMSRPLEAGPVKSVNKAQNEKLINDAFGGGLKETPLMKPAPKVVLAKSLAKQQGKLQKENTKELGKIIKDLEKDIKKEEKKQKEFTPTTQAAIKLSEGIDRREKEIDQQGESEHAAIVNLKKENEILHSKLTVILDLINEYEGDDSGQKAKLEGESFDISAQIMNNDDEIKNLESTFGQKKLESADGRIENKVLMTNSKLDENIVSLEDDIAKLKKDISSDTIQNKIDQKEHELLGITNGNPNWSSNMWVQQKVVGLFQEIKTLEKAKNDPALHTADKEKSLVNLAEKEATLRKMVEIRNSDVVANLFSEMKKLEEGDASVSENRDGVDAAAVSHEEVSVSHAELDIDQIKNNQAVLKFVSDKLTGLMQGIDVGHPENEIPDSLRPALDYLKRNDEVFEKTWAILNME